MNSEPVLDTGDSGAVSETETGATDGSNTNVDQGSTETETGTDTGATDGAASEESTSDGGEGESNVDPYATNWYYMNDGSTVCTNDGGVETQTGKFVF